MNVYDFDKTIYRGDSTLNFYLFSLWRNPIIVMRFPKQIIAYIKYRLGFITKVEFKEKFYIFLHDIKNIDEEVIVFWKKNLSKIAPWYIDQANKSDVIISASPEFLLKPACEKLGIRTLIASRVDKFSGKYTGQNCYGDEKVKRFKEQCGNEVINSFYSDSRSDEPMAKLALKAFYIKGNEIVLWYGESK